MDVIMATSGASSFSLSKQGMGTRSLASVLLFQLTPRGDSSSLTTQALHPFLAIEEPETHLHPQAQRAIFGQIEQINGQILISSHSPYVCSRADVRSFILFSKSGNESQVSHFDDDPDELGDEDHRKIRRHVMNTRGDLLFSRCIVLFEGETEEQALPDFAHYYWGKHIHEFGYSFIAVDGKDSYTAFLRLAKRFCIPWKIFPTVLRATSIR